MSGSDQVYRAISDPTRRRILDILADRERPVKELTESFPISQPALSQHLRVLREAGLVRVRREGRMRVYSSNAAPLRAVSDWLSRNTRLWPGDPVPYGGPRLGKGGKD